MQDFITITNNFLNITLSIKRDLTFLFLKHVNRYCCYLRFICTMKLFLCTPNVIKDDRSWASCSSCAVAWKSNILTRCAIDNRISCNANVLPIQLRELCHSINIVHNMMMGSHEIILTRCWRGKTHRYPVEWMILLAIARDRTFQVLANSQG